jgi:glycosyltransferase involved in cell wall biosynthesis
LKNNTHKQAAITVVVPLYNAVAYLPALIASLQAQTATQGWRCILVDDGSTDGSLELATELTTGDSRFVVAARHSQWPRGGNGARNMGAELATTSHLLFLDGDDLLAADALEHRLADLDTYPRTDMLVYPGRVFRHEPGDDDRLINLFSAQSSKHQLLSRFLRQDMPFCTHSVLWRKAFFEQIGGWKNDLRRWQDWELHVRALSRGAQLQLLPQREPDIYYRQGAKKQMSASYESLTYKRAAWTAVVAASHEISLPEHRDLLRRLIVRVFLHELINEAGWKAPARCLRGQPHTAIMSRIKFNAWYLRLLLSKFAPLRHLIDTLDGREARTWYRTSSQFLKHRAPVMATKAGKAASAALFFIIDMGEFLWALAG